MLPRAPLRFVGALVASVALTAFCAFASPGCGPEQTMVWFCLNPVTGKVDNSYYDPSNVANGMPDPCHCYDPCGPAKTCPIEVDAGGVGGASPGGCEVDAGDGG